MGIRFIIKKFDFLSYFVTTQQSIRDLISAFTAPKFGSFLT